MNKSSLALPPLTTSGRKLAPLIDHSLLSANAAAEDIRRLCAEARFYGFCAVCVRPQWVPLACAELAGTGIAPATVIGFPSGSPPTAVKVREAEQAVAAGALELDMVLALWALKDQEYKTVGEDIAAVVRAAGPGRLVKVILETCLLTEEEKITACRLAVDAGAGFVKTSTGFAGGGATVEDVRLLRRTVGPTFGVKASGGIRTAEAARALVAAGANRLGTSASVAIVTTD